ncbi:hypothetical protein GGX14DRAFT_424863 [Mycena pura]|uniref:Uncharacterized protein n=1 Tax=Mycena pura TaxID=153505 RepID=A0AAD7E1W2_9AGAR|nr:hypothetical protein GGX14DRAFT_424863 [Mycena pura]
MSFRGGSRRWNYFHSALELAIQQSAHKWTFEDFTECFPQYVEEDKEGAMQMFHQVAGYIESESKKKMDKLFSVYNLQVEIDSLDRLVSEAKARKASGIIGPDVWTENIRPHSAVCGRTVPILQSQVERLRDSLAKMESENQSLISELETNVNESNKLTNRASGILDKLDETYDAWESVPMEELHTWTAQVAEGMRPTLRS